MRHELGRQAADAVAREAAFEGGEGAAGQVDRDLGAGFIHRQQEAVARDAGLGAERSAAAHSPSASAQSSTV